MVGQLHLQDRVRFVGPLYGKDKLAAYVDADVLASPAMYEIFGLVAFEALLCGTPVIVGNNCGVGKIFAESGTGNLVPYGDVEVLAKTLRMILDRPEEAKQKVKAGQTYIRANLDWKIIVQKLEQIYQTTAEIYERLPA
jgi:glycosyltransferase involved in cell wall biosynthesis